MKKISILVLGAAALKFASPDAFAATEAGVAAAVNPQATGTPPAGTARILEVGSNLVINETVETSASGNTQLLFRDGSTVTIGPNAKLTIDSFVYDPEKRTAKLVMSSAGGLIRLIGGRASKDGDGVQINTPSATIGIRGGIGEVGVDPNTGEGLARFLFGDQMTVNNGGDTQTLSVPNFQVSFGPEGGIGTPQIITPQSLSQSQTQFEGQPNPGGNDQATQADQNSGLLADTNSAKTPRDNTQRQIGRLTIGPGSREKEINKIAVDNRPEIGSENAGTGFNAALLIPSCYGGECGSTFPSFNTTFAEYTSPDATVSGSVTIDGTASDFVKLTTVSTITPIEGSFTTSKVVYAFSGNHVIDRVALPNLRIAALKQGSINIETITNGVFDGPVLFSLGSEILPFAVGTPVNPSLMPVSGTYTYGLASATPAYLQGTGLSGVFNGTLTISITGPLTSVASNLTAGLSGTLNMSAANATTYTISVPNSTVGMTGSTVGGFFLANSSTYAVIGGGCASCSISISGFLAGASGANAAIVYKTTDIPLGTIVGAAAFTRQ